MLDQVTAALRAIVAQGAFATELVCESDNLRVEVQGAGPLRFPLSARAARQLSEVAQLAPFGRRDKTLSDLSVRNTWEIDGRHVKIDARAWNRTLVPQLAVLRKRLGLPDEGELKASFDKLLVYGPGQFFAPHQDSERADDMVATLVVLLPSAASGGALVVEHQGKKKVFRGARRGPKDLALIAFYADCHHEVRPVKSGYRVALTYQLHYQATARDERPSPAPDAVARLAREIKTYFNGPPLALRPDRLIYLLDHEYTQKSLSFERLKNADRLRVEALLQAADLLGCECHLALADVRENWSCYGDDDWDRGYSRRRWRDDDDDDDDDDDYDDYLGGGEPEAHELGELYDSNVELRCFVGRDGRTQKDMTMTPRGGEICFTRASVDMDPFKSEYEGYMGNYGNTMERWYHRAALVLWPRDRTFAVRAELSPRWAVKEISASLKARRLDEARAQARALLPRWDQTAPQEESATFFRSLLAILPPLADADLALRLLSPLGPERLKEGAMAAFLTVLETFGLSWAQRLFTTWTSKRGYGAPAWLPLLPGLCRALRESAGESGNALALWLLAREVDSLRQTREVTLRFRSEDTTGEQHDPVVALLESAAALDAAELRDRLIAILIAPKTGLSLMSAGALLQRCRAERRPAEVRALGLHALYRHVVDTLTQVLAAPGRAANDWSIEPPVGCSCELCQELARFLRARDRVVHAWPLAEQRRRHVHDIIDRNHLPVTHTTLRQGRPFTLFLKKQQALFARDAALRAQQQKLLSWLKKEQAAFAAAVVPRLPGKSPDQ